MHLVIFYSQEKTSARETKLEGQENLLDTLTQGYSV